MIVFYRDVEDRGMVFTLKRDPVGVTYYPPVPGNVPGGLPGGFAETLDPKDVAARINRDTADMAVFDQAIRTKECYDVFCKSNAETIAAKTAGFWRDSRDEFIAKTWEPARHVDWCLPHDERRDLGLTDEKIWD